MGRLGEGAPVLVWEGYTIELPKPRKGGRRERFVKINPVYENILGELISTENRWRFEGEYEFGYVDPGILDTLFDIYNKTATVKWIPHNDLPAVAFQCIIDDIEPDSLKGIIRLDTVKIKVKSKFLLTKIPTMNALYGCFRCNYIGVKEG